MIDIVDIEAAINHWRRQKPSSDSDKAVCREVSVLADVYALMIVGHTTQVDITHLNSEQMTALVTANDGITGHAHD